jgi:hypothetical protein
MAVPNSRQARISRKRGRYRKTQQLADVVLDVLDGFDGAMSTRQVFYQCVSRGAIDNNDTEYDRVQRLLVDMRRSGEIPYRRIIDRTRAKHQRAGWDSAAEIITATGNQFRRDLWATQDTIVMIGLEKEALEGVFAEVVDEFGASLWTLHGYGSLAFLFDWAEEIKEYVEIDGKNVVIYYFGDHDPRGLDIERAVTESLRDEHGAEFVIQRIGLLPDDFDRFNLINVPVKSKDRISGPFVERYGARAAELDALPPDELQTRIRRCFDNHVDHDELRRIRRAEALERETLQLVAGNWDKVVATVRGGAP